MVGTQGLEIIFGCYGMNEEDQKKVDEAEVVHHLNVAACHLKLKNYLKAISSCKTVSTVMNSHQ